MNHVHDKNNLFALLQTNKCAIIKFSAAWCGPCRVIAPYIDELTRTNPDICFISVDVDESDDIPEIFNVQSMPTFVAMVNGQQLTRVEGAMKGKIDDMLAALVAYL